MEFDKNDNLPRKSRNNNPANHQEDSRDITDDEKESDSDFMEEMDKIVYFEDLDQKYKGANINYTGKIKGLSKEH